MKIRITLKLKKNIKIKLTLKMIYVNNTTLKFRYALSMIAVHLLKQFNKEVMENT